MRATATRLPLLYDAGALIAAEADDRLFLRLHRQALDEGRKIVVPVPVLAQVWRGSAKQTSLARMLHGCEVVDMTEAIGRAAGALCGRNGTCDVVDATVVVMAIDAVAAVVTSDPEDITALIDSANPPIRPAVKVV
ncbi:hypothetical protein GCM10010156_66720 [Planobispora rosea]|uniref:PIN domain-containing protein n=1 Tax=Planobispora rosea TaxID=35762 RepID=A0A8J3S735_PLARO|nr:PIN domain-containing protein [Planobispora rosea]GGS99319.1 hypothetical protein GCM10010156_66720 [Planobispora rosea]GIH88034.1 hypothetical protein Pro02_64420 [Planobispora rosea]